jgi:F5/8 type C domain
MQPYFAMADAVDLAPRVALVTHEVLRKPSADELAQALALLGATYDRHQVGHYTVFLNLRRPVGAVREVPPTAFTLRASHAGALAGHAVDRNIETAWHADGPPAPGLSLEVTLDRPRPLARVVLDPGAWVDASPRGLRVELSEDGRAWRTVVDVAQHLGGIDWLGDHPRLRRQGHIAVWWHPAPARFVRLTQTAAPAPRWAVAELLLYEAVDGGGPAGPPGLSAGDGQQVLDAVTAEGIRSLYSFDEANVWFARHRAAPPWRSKPLRTVSLHDPRPPAESGRAVRFQHKRAFFLREASPALEARLAAHGVAVERRDLPAGVLYVTSPRRGVAPLYWAHQQLFALDPS